MSTLVRFLASGLFTVLAAANALAQYGNEVELTAGTERVIFAVNREVTILVYIRNLSEGAVELLEPAVDKRSLTFEIIDPNGKKDSLLQIYGLELKKIRLLPKKRIKFNARFTPELLGEYTIQVKYLGYEEKVLTALPLTIHVVKEIKAVTPPPEKKKSAGPSPDTEKRQ
ncbi:MAG: hypothetical protein NC924_08270 [Candidatus Omnitrophica bacterium]|nr:hypothetical protein [Candidatus Omnitrophota bacterium]